MAVKLIGKRLWIVPLTLVVGFLILIVWLRMFEAMYCPGRCGGLGEFLVIPFVLTFLVIGLASRALGWALQTGTRVKRVVWLANIGTAVMAATGSLLLFFPVYEVPIEYQVVLPFFYLLPSALWLVGDLARGSWD